MRTSILFQAVLTSTPTSTSTATPAPISQLTPNYGIIEFFRDPFWQFAGALLALAALLLTVWLSRDRQCKKLTPILITAGPLINAHILYRQKHRLRVSIDDEPPSEAYVATLIVRIMNTGTMPISTEDFSGPIRFDFDEGSKVLAANVVETGPKNFDAVAEASGTRALLHPVLLNKDHYVTVEVLVREAQTFEMYAYLKATDVEPIIDFNDWLETRSTNRSQLLWSLLFGLATYGIIDIIVNIFRQGFSFLLFLIIGGSVGALIGEVISRIWRYIRRRNLHRDAYGPRSGGR